jgi:hypothetical protein
MVRVVFVVGWVDTSLAAGAAALVSVDGAGCDEVAGADSVVTGCVCCAASWAIAEVEESAIAAAIAGRARVRA